MLGGLSIVVFGLIAATAGASGSRTASTSRNARNLITVAVALVLGAGNFKLTFGGFTLDGIGTATFGGDHPVSPPARPDGGRSAGFRRGAFTGGRIA